MGIEFDLRSEGKKLILHHDPFKKGLEFEKLLQKYRHAFMIVNVKSEGLEEPARKLLKKYGVRDYFFLDLSFPALIRLTREKEKNIAVRYSEYEPVEQCLALIGKVRWIWIDCFNKMPLSSADYKKLKKHFKLCLVSPELQKYPKSYIAKFKRSLKNFKIDAICTKYPDLWKKNS